MENAEKTDEMIEDVVVTTSPDRAPAWAMIEPGRYQPRRIRGSCVGRELG